MLRAHARFSLSLTQLFLSAVALVAAPAGIGQGPARELLNSERIAAAFGSYGVEVLEQSDTLRVSNLFSGAGEERICRTFAVVRYAARIDAPLVDAHAAIVAGGSIGAVFAARGFEVRKTHLHYGEHAASAKIASLMDVAPGSALAEHVYVLDVVKDGRVLEYAALVEIHHPDYLGRADLAAIYGALDETRGPLVAAVLATAREHSR
jgi:hypothetical protein